METVCLPSLKYLPSVLSQSKFAEHWVAIVCWMQSGLVVDGESGQRSGLAVAAGVQT